MRTGAKEMYLATLDDKVSDEVLKQLENENIVLITTKTIKKTKYASKTVAVSFEELFESCIANEKYWEEYFFSEQDRKEIIKQYKYLMEKDSMKHPYYVEYLQKMINKMNVL